MRGAKFHIEKFDGTEDFRLCRIKMRALLIQHRCEAALEVLPADMEAEQKLREVIVETTAAGVWSKLETLYTTKSLASKFYLKKLYTFYMLAGRKIFEHIDVFNKIVLDLANIEVTFKDEDLALLLLTSLPSSYEHFVDTLLYEHEALTLEDVMATLNSKEIIERSKAKRDNSEGLYARGRTNRRDHWKTNCPENNRKKSTSYVKKDDQPISSGSIFYDFEGMMVMSAEECDGGSVLLGDNKKCKIRGIGKSGKVKVINGSRIVLSGTQRVNCVYSLDGHAVAGAGKAGAVWQEESKVEAISRESDWRTVKKLRTYNGLEFCNRKFEQLCIKRYPEGVKGYRLYKLDDESPKIVTSRNMVFNESVMYKDTLKHSGVGTDKNVKELQVELVGDREPRTRTKPLRYQDECNMATYTFAAVEDEDTHDPLTYQEAVAYEDSSK
ncbi:hypothetical protein Tco_0419241 [Tanacetum coccineum]